MMYMKRFITVIVIVFTSLSFAVPVSAKEQSIKVLINGEKLITDTEPVIRNGIVLVPFRALFEALGFDVTWNDFDKSVTAATRTKNGNIIRYIHFEIRDTQAYISNHGATATFDIPPVSIGGRTMVPLQFLVDALDMVVLWDETEKAITIDYKDIYLDSQGFIVNKAGGSTDKSDMAFLELRDYEASCQYLLALGEDQRLYAVSRSDLRYRAISQQSSYEIDMFQVIFYNNRFYYVDRKSSFSDSIIKESDGENEKEFSCTDSGFVKISNRLYFTYMYHNPEGSIGIKYIDMDINEEFIITDAQYARLLYASGDAVFYEVYTENENGLQAELYVGKVNGNEDEDRFVLKAAVGNLMQPGIWGSTSGDDVYISPGSLEKVGDSYVFFDTFEGMYLFNPSAGTLTKFTDIVAQSIYYSNNRLYLIKLVKDTQTKYEIGYIDFSNNNYSKLFSKKEFFLTYRDRIDGIDPSGDILFTHFIGIGMEHYNEYQYKYSVKDNKLIFIHYEAGRENEKCDLKVGDAFEVDEY